jgi:putative transposase
MVRHGVISAEPGCWRDVFLYGEVTLRDRSSDVLVRHVGLLRNAFRTVRTERPFTIDAIVILRDHLHAIWTLPDDDADYSGHWRAIKSNYTHACGNWGCR